MKPITLTNQSPDGIPLSATFVPDKGMNLNSYKLGEIEVMDQSTREDFEKNFCGLGPLIGPHFHLHPPHLRPKIEDLKKFPHIEHLPPADRSDPFPHGIARYAPWTAKGNEHAVHATLSGKDTWEGIPLSELEGQNFKMGFEAHLLPDGLHLNLSVVSDKDSLVGIHYYYGLPNGKGTIISQVQDHYLYKREKHLIPEEWNFDSQQTLTYPLDRDTDYTLIPYPDPLNGKITLVTDTHQLVTRYKSNCQENSWQLWHPKGASFVCIEPVSSQDPRHPNLTVSSIAIHLQIIKN